jgi:preprotein translocase subunit YajC
MGNSPVSTILLIALMVVAFYFLLLRPQKKRQQAQQKTMNEIVPGTRVLLGSGIFGTVVSTGEKQAVLETSPGVHVTVLKQAIARVIRPGDEFSEPAETDNEIDDEPVDQDAVEPVHSDDAYRPSTSEYGTTPEYGTTEYGKTEYDRPAADNPTFGNEPKNKD